MFAHANGQGCGEAFAPRGERAMESMSKSDMIDQAAREWVRLLASGEAAATDLVAIRLWLAEPAHARAFERERAFWQDLELHGRLFAETAHASPTTRRGLRRFAPRWRPPIGKRAVAGAMAACLALALAGPDLALRLRADHIAPTGSIRSVTLADGSAAMLDSGSAIAVDYSNEQRRVALLRGRAWFNVKHGDKRPFRVVASGGVTEDIGTAFEVSRDDRVEVAVSEGSVRVAAGNGALATRLDAGQRARYADGAMERIADKRSDRIAAWRNGELLIDNAPLAQAIAEVKRYRSGPVIVLAGLDKAKPVSAVFRTDHPDDALAALAAGANLELTRLPGGAILIH